MSQAYTPGLEVTEATVVRKLRELPLPGETLVALGDRVTAQTPVLSANLPGDLQVVRIAERMGLEPADVIDGLQVKVGDRARRGELLCETRTFFGLFTSRVESPVSGEVEFFTEANAHLGIRLEPIPLTVDAYIDGVVTDIEEGKSVTIETEAALIQGIFGVGGERLGNIFPLGISPSEVVTRDWLINHSQSLEDAILIGGSQFDIEALRYASEMKASAVITGSIDATTLQQFVGHEIGVSITGDEDVPLTLIITEGFGQLALSERIQVLAEKLAGQSASINGATQVRAGAMRPEVIVPRESQAGTQRSDSSARLLQIGSPIRLVRVPYFGIFGEVSALPPEPEVIESGAKVRVLKARLEDGREVTVPRANVELV